MTNSTDKKGFQFYYIRIKEKYDGNDCYWVSDFFDNTKWKSDSNLNNALIFTHNQAMTMIQENSCFEAYPVHFVESVVCYHVTLRKIKKKYEFKDNELYLLCSKRDTVGTNASFWKIYHKGYSAEYRSAQIFTYEDCKIHRSRTFEFFVPLSVVKKKAEKRVDFQDIVNNRQSLQHHSLVSSLEDVEFIKIDRLKEI